MELNRLTDRKKYLTRDQLPLLRELRTDALLEFLENERNALSWAPWMVTFPYFARLAADRSEAALLSWLVAEVLPTDAPGPVKRIVWNEEQWMRVRLHPRDPDPAKWLRCRLGIPCAWQFPSSHRPPAVPPTLNPAPLGGASSLER
jgi:hypothetical protein